MKVESLKYPDIEVDYSPGKPPVIHFYDGEEEVEETPLSSMSFDAIVELVQSKGLMPVPDAPHEDA